MAERTNRRSPRKSHSIGPYRVSGVRVSCDSHRRGPARSAKMNDPEITHCSTPLPTRCRCRPPRSAALLLDLDGTIADTLPLIFDAFRHAVAPWADRPPTDAEVEATFGPAERDCLANFAPGECLDDAEARFFDFYEGEHERMVRLVEGIGGAIDRARAHGWKVGVFTGKGRRAARFTLEALGLLDRLDCVISGDDVERPKPDPDGLRRAAACTGRRTVGRPDGRRQPGRHPGRPRGRRPDLRRHLGRLPPRSARGRAARSHVPARRGVDRPDRRPSCRISPHGLILGNPAISARVLPAASADRTAASTESVVRPSRAASAWTVDCAAARSSGPSAIASTSAKRPSPSTSSRPTSTGRPSKSEGEGHPDLPDRSDRPEAEPIEEPAHRVERRLALGEWQLDLLAGLGRAAELRTLVGDPVRRALAAEPERLVGRAEVAGRMGEVGVLLLDRLAAAGAELVEPAGEVVVIGPAELHLDFVAVHAGELSDGRPPRSIAR